MTGVVEKKYGSAQRFFLMISKGEIMGYKVIKISVVAFWQREIFDPKAVKYLNESKSLKIQSYICLC